jgi:hypothetical protein
MLKKLLSVVIAIGFVLCAEVGSDTRALQTSANAIAVDNDDLAGTVTGPSGPEAGVWVIAETTDLSTPFAKIVVTDDRGRYLMPGPSEGELPSLGTRIRARGFAEDAGAPGKTSIFARCRRPLRQRRPVLSGRVLAVADGDAGKQRIPGTGESGNGISPNMQEPGRLDPHA